MFSRRAVRLRFQFVCSRTWRTNARSARSAASDATFFRETESVAAGNERTEEADAAVMAAAAAIARLGGSDDAVVAASNSKSSSGRMRYRRIVFSSWRTLPGQ